MQKQKDLETKSWNVPTETVTQQALKHPKSRHESLEDDNVEDVNCPPQSPFDNEPLPTTRIRPPRKVSSIFIYFLIPDYCNKYAICHVIDSLRRR